MRFTATSSTCRKGAVPSTSTTSTALAARLCPSAAPQSRPTTPTRCAHSGRSTSRSLLTTSPTRGSSCASRSACPTGSSFSARTRIRSRRNEYAATGSISTTGFKISGPAANDFTHILNLAGVLRLPARVDLGFNFSYSSVPPFSAYIGGIDFNGDGTTGDLLPGTTVNVFNRGMGGRIWNVSSPSSTRRMGAGRMHMGTAIPA